MLIEQELILPPVPTTPCVDHGVGQRDDYAHLEGRQMHRVLWEREHGPLPEKITLDHLCRNKRCIRLDHLEPVPHRVNTSRGGLARWEKAGIPNRPRSRIVPDACRRGHPLTPENTYITVSGSYSCRTCKRLSKAGTLR